MELTATKESEAKTLLKQGLGYKFLDWLYEDKEASMWMPSKFEKYQALLRERCTWKGQQRKD